MDGCWIMILFSSALVSLYRLLTIQRINEHGMCTCKHAYHHREAGPGPKDLYHHTQMLSLSIFRFFFLKLPLIRETIIFLGPPERARAESGGADQWVLKRMECSGFARVNKITSASLGYPLSVFNKNSTLKGLVFPFSSKLTVGMCC